MGKDPPVTGAQDLRTLVREMRDELNEQFKKTGESLRFGSDDALAPQTLATGIPSLDHLLEGGFQKGQITLVAGLFSSGKTTLMLLAAKQVQQAGGIAAIIDVERAFNPDWARALGVDPDLLLVSQPRTGEAAFRIAYALAERGIGLIGIDSLIAMVPSRELDHDQHTLGQQAQMINAGLRGILSRLVTKETVVIAINQIRLGIGVVYGNPEFLPGGKGQEYYAYQLIRCRRGPWIVENDKRVGFQMKFKVEKSKAGEPFRSCEVPFRFEGVFDTEQALYDLAIKLGLILKTGANYTVPGITDKRFFGQKRLKDYFAEHPEKFELLRRRVQADTRSLGEEEDETRAADSVDGAAPELVSFPE